MVPTATVNVALMDGLLRVTLAGMLRAEELLARPTVVTLATAAVIVTVHLKELPEFTVVASQVRDES
jgi:hypothetical protein